MSHDRINISTSQNPSGSLERRQAELAQRWSKFNFVHQDELCPACGEVSIAADKRTLPSGWWGAIYVHEWNLDGTIPVKLCNYYSAEPEDPADKA